MTRVRLDMFVSLDGYTPISTNPVENPMGDGWERISAGHTATRTFRKRVFGDDTGAGTTGIDESFTAAFFEGIGAEIMGATMFGLHAFPDDPDWKGWWGDHPPFGWPLYVLTHTAPRPAISMEGGTTFNFRSGGIQDVLAEATAAAGQLDVRIGGGYGTASEFLRAGLVDDIHLMVAPTVLGGGNRLWDELRGVELTHKVTTQVSESGTTHVVFTR